MSDPIEQFTLEVTQEDIDKSKAKKHGRLTGEFAQWRSSTHCPVSVAAARAMGVPLVGSANGKVFHAEGVYAPEKYDEQDTVRNFQSYFDNDLVVEPLKVIMYRQK